ncbi:MAG: hypothetical protein QW356_04695 [Candidatus Hadarchaeales archaeon]
MPLLTDGLLHTGFVRPVRPLVQSLLRGPIMAIPEPAKKYALRISESTGVPVEKVLRSRPFRNYLEAMWGR